MIMLGEEEGIFVALDIIKIVEKGYKKWMILHIQYYQGPSFDLYLCESFCYFLVGFEGLAAKVYILKLSFFNLNQKKFPIIQMTAALTNILSIKNWI